jgi:hypothetical protein
MAHGLYDRIGADGDEQDGKRKNHGPLVLGDEVARLTDQAGAVLRKGCTPGVALRDGRGRFALRGLGGAARRGDEIGAGRRRLGLRACFGAFAPSGKAAAGLDQEIFQRRRGRHGASLAVIAPRRQIGGVELRASQILKIARAQIALAQIALA